MADDCKYCRGQEWVCPMCSSPDATGECFCAEQDLVPCSFCEPQHLIDAKSALEREERGK